ncbi:MAG: stealth family protein [Clostridia bacterium]|nr:stealth family protein [Clostridia bacterium]
MKYSNKIDAVILWVDGNDPEWIKEKNNYSNVKGDSSINRFRDFNNLQYLFRGIEKYASWIHHIFFVTWGHIPSWLNTNNQKIRIIRHDEFIPKKYLPTFNSNVIETNLHRIKDLSEQFILLNDDIFILNHLKETDFFYKDLPKDFYVEYIKKNCSKRHSILRKNYNNVLAKHFNKTTFLKNNFFKILNIKYGFHNLKTIRYFSMYQFNDILSLHLSQPCLKSTFFKVWEQEYKILDIACENKFRSNTDLGQGIFRYFNLFNGKFIPTIMNGKYFTVLDDNTRLIKTIKNQKYNMICINDSYPLKDFVKAQNEINNSLAYIFPDKSDFEI